jgi:hypothetical protein
VPTSTRQTYYRAVLDLLFPERYQRYGTATADSATSITDAVSFSTSFTQTSHLIGSWIRVTGATTGGTQYAQIASVSAGGVITFDRTLTDPTGTVTWELTYEHHPGHIDAMLTQVLQNTYSPRMFPLSSHIITNDDNDMESTATITGMWSNSSGTLVKETSIVPLLGGTQSLKVTATATPGYAYMASDMDVTAGEQYYASVLCKVTTGDSAEFRIVNVDSSNATIENATTDELTWNELGFYFTPPTDCERINAFLVSTTNTDITYWDDLSFIRTAQRIFPTPSWLNWTSQFIDVIELPRGSSDPSADNGYLTLDRQWQSVGSVAGPGSTRSNQELAIHVDPFSGNRRYIYAMSPGAALTTDAATGYLDPDVVAENTVYLLKNPDRAPKFLRALREGTMKADIPTPKLQAMAHFA